MPILKIYTSILFLFILLPIPTFSASNISSKKNPIWPNIALQGANVSTSASAEDLHHFAKVWGGKVVRVLHLNPLSNKPPYAILEDALKDMYRTTDLALKEGLAVVFAPGVAMEDNDTFFSSSLYQSAFIAFWKRVAEHYQNEKGIIAYDLMNEPHDKIAQAKWSEYAATLTQEIRKIDPIHTIMIEPQEWGWPAGFQYLKPILAKNIVYSFHTYAPNEFTVQKSKGGFLTATEEEWKTRIYPGSKIENEIWDAKTMAKKMEPAFEFAKKNKVTLWCGEFGTARWAKGAETWLKDMIQIFEAHHIGWSYYSYREWQVMDLEMNPEIKNQKTPRSDTAFVRILKKAYHSH